MIDRNPIDEALFDEVSRLEWKRVESYVRAALNDSCIYTNQSLIVSVSLDQVILNNLYNPFVRGFNVYTNSK